MLHHLANYLLHYKQVGIPHVGTVLLVQRPPVLNVADKIIEPPSYAVEINNRENITEHQLNFLNGATGKGKEAVINELHSFGDAVKHKMANGGYEWEGIGTIEANTERLSFSLPALQPVIAEKVIRQDASHTVLVGDKEVQSLQSAEANPIAAPIKKKQTTVLVIGWILFVLSLLAIAFVLYAGQFAVNASGSKLSPKTWFKLNEGSSQP